MDLLVQGLTLSLTGLVVTFASLGLFILIIVLLQRFFGPEQPMEQTASETSSVSLPETMEADLEPETAAAIAIAIEYFRNMEAEASSIGSAFSQGPGAWWQARQYPAEPVRPRQLN